jgi:hypothetical protein
MSFKELIKAELELIPEQELQKLYDIIKDWRKHNQEHQQEHQDDLGALLANCEISTGIPDLSYQHDHYLHGTPKREIE